MKHSAGALLVLILFAFLSPVKSNLVKTTNRPQAGQWSKTGPSFLRKLFKHLIASGSDLSRLGATQVHGIYTTVKHSQNVMSSANVVNLFSRFNGTSLPLNQTFLVRLHLSVEARTGAPQGYCSIVLYDVKSNTEVLTEDIPCDTSSKLQLTVTVWVKRWITNSSENQGMRAEISARNANFPHSSLPFISSDPNVEPPFYVLYL